MLQDKLQERSAFISYILEGSKMSITNETSSFQRLKRFIYKIVNMTILAKIILFVSDILKNAIDFDIIPHGKVGWFHVTFFILEHNVDYVIAAISAAIL